MNARIGDDNFGLDMVMRKEGLGKRNKNGNRI